MEATVKSVRKIGMTIAGASLLIVGLVMLALPGPGVPLIIGGLTLLAKEFRWAERLLTRVKLLVSHVLVMVRRAFAKSATSLKRA